MRGTFGERATADKLRAIDVSAGSWQGRDFTGAEYVDAIRGDLDARLNSLGLE